MKETIYQWRRSALSGERTYTVPIMTHPGIELTGSTVWQAVSSGEAHSKAIEALAKRYATDAVTVIMDLTVEAEAFGAKVLFTPNEVPSVVGRLLQSKDDVERLPLPLLSAGRIPEYLKANLLAARNITQKPVLAGCIGPFSLAGRLYGLSEFMQLCFTDRTTAETLLMKCADFIDLYLEALKGTSVSGVVMAEPAAGLLSQEDCMRFSTRYIRPMVRHLQGDDFLIVLHNCGNQGHCTRAMVESEALALHFGNKADMREVIGDMPSDVLAMGNLDPVTVFKEGTPESVFRATSDLLLAMRGHKNFVLSSGCDMPPHTPLENIDAFFRAAM